MKKLTILLFALLVAVGAQAQEHRQKQEKFSPERFQAELEQFISVFDESGALKPAAVAVLETAKGYGMIAGTGHLSG